MLNQSDVYSMESIPNFRSIAGSDFRNGFQIKRGLLFRSGELAYASDSDLRVLSALGIKTICDLRTHRERSKYPDHLPDHAPIKTVHIPIKSRKHNESGLLTQLFSHRFGTARRLDYDRFSQEIYQEFVTDFQEEFSSIIRLAADADNLPMLIHCTAGKDRTGFASALIQVLLGMRLEQVLQDYLLSNDYLQAFKTKVLQRLWLFAFFGIPRQKFIPLLEARSAYLTAALAQITTSYQSMTNYFRTGLGLSDSEQGQLKQLLLEKIC